MVEVTSGTIYPIDTSKKRQYPNPQAYPQSKNNYEPIGNSELGIYTAEQPQKIKEWDNGFANSRSSQTSSKSNSTYNLNNMNSGFHDKDIDEHLNKMYGAGNHKGITRSSRRNRKGSNPMDLSFNSFFNF